MNSNANHPSSKKISFIYWFAYYNCDSPSVRYRGKYPLDYIKEHFGIRSKLIIPGYRPDRMWKFIVAYFSALFFCKQNDLIVVQRISTNWIYSNALKLLTLFRKKNMSYDLDDADYLNEPPQSIYFFARKCSRVFAGSDAIAKHLSGFNPNIIINTSPTPVLNVVKKKRNEIFTIGWIGEFGGEHKDALMNHFMPAMKDLPFKVNLLMMGIIREEDRQVLSTYFKSIKNVSLIMPENIPWTNEFHLQLEISKFDVGIATLLDTEMHRSKSGFKIKQYLNNGVPVLSSDIPENNRYVTKAHNGFLCETPADFHQGICELEAMSDSEYSKFSSNARASATKFNMHAYCERLLL